jgi:hypothetical protein
MVAYVINYNEFLQQNNKETIQTTLNMFENVCEKINMHCGSDLGKITTIHHFVEIINRFSIEKVNIESYFVILLLFSKKNNKKMVNKTKIHDYEQLKQRIEDLNIEPFIDWLFT